MSHYCKAKQNVNYRTGPGTKYKKVGVIKENDIVKVVGKKGNWLKIEKNKKYFYTSAKYYSLAVDYGAEVAKLVKPIAETVVKNRAEHVSGAYRYTGKKVNCSVFVSAVLQEAGVLPKSTTLYHTSKNHKKSRIGDVVHNRKKVEHYTWHKTDKPYSKLPNSYKKKGTVYIYASSVAIKGEDGIIYGCHSSGKKYTNLSMIRHKNNGAYEYTHHILAVGVPMID